jgi:hypothetical protein
MKTFGSKYFYDGFLGKTRQHIQYLYSVKPDLKNTTLKDSGKMIGILVYFDLSIINYFYYECG